MRVNKNTTLKEWCDYLESKHGTKIETQDCKTVAEYLRKTGWDSLADMIE